MEEPATPPTGIAAWTRRDTILLLLLFACAAGLRLWHLTHTEVTARDSIGFIRIAWQFLQHTPKEWPGVIDASEQHPAYPLAVATLSRLLRGFLQGPETWRMQVSAQLVSALAAILLVWPLFALGREFFDRRVGVGVALLVQFFPVSGRLLTDGLSEALFLLFSATALYGAFRGLRTRQPVVFALTGSAGGLAYLTRPEGALLVAATGCVLLATPFIAGWKRSWANVAVCGGALAVPALLLAAPLVLSTGRVTIKPTGQRILDQVPPSMQPTAVPEARAVGSPLLAVWWQGEEDPSQRRLWGARVLLTEIIQGSLYVGWVPALLGLWWFRARFRTTPGVWVMALVSAGVALALWRVAVVVGYISDRHTLLILLCGAYWAVAALLTLGEQLLTRRGMGAEKAHRWALVVPLAFACCGLPKTLEPLHQHRAGFRQVGQWLAEHTDPSDEVDDPYCWSHYHSGRVFLEGLALPVPPGHRHLTYIVLEDAGNPHLRLGPRLEEARKRTEEGAMVLEWKGKRGKKPVVIRVYAVPE